LIDSLKYFYIFTVYELNPCHYVVYKNSSYLIIKMFLKKKKNKDVKFVKKIIIKMLILILFFIDGIRTKQKIKHGENDYYIIPKIVFF